MNKNTEKRAPAAMAEIELAEVIGECGEAATCFLLNATSIVHEQTKDADPALIAAHMQAAALLFHGRIVRKAADDICAAIATSTASKRHGI